MRFTDKTTVEMVQHLKSNMADWTDSEMKPSAWIRRFDIRLKITAQRLGIHYTVLFNSLKNETI